VSYSQVDRKQPHAIEIYYKGQFTDSNFTETGTDSSGNADKAVPYPGREQLAAAGAALCDAEIGISKGGIARPKGSDYGYAALVPSQDVWTGQNLPDKGEGDQDVICVMWNRAAPSLPANTSGG
jgi:hypothetical protein